MAMWNGEDEALDFEMECVEDQGTHSFSSREAESSSPRAEASSMQGAASGIGNVGEHLPADHVAREVTRLLEEGEISRTLHALMAEQAAALMKSMEEKLKNLQAASVRGGGRPRGAGGRPTTSTPNVSKRRCKGECSGRNGGSSRDGRSEIRAGGDLVEPFDPEDPESNENRGIYKIYQLATIHGSSEYEKCCFKHEKLHGAARTWFNRLYDTTSHEPTGRPPCGRLSHSVMTSPYWRSWW